MVVAPARTRRGRVREVGCRAHSLKLRVYRRVTKTARDYGVLGSRIEDGKENRNCSLAGSSDCWIHSLFVADH